VAAAASAGEVRNRGHLQSAAVQVWHQCSSREPTGFGSSLQAACAVARPLPRALPSSADASLWCALASAVGVGWEGGGAGRHEAVQKRHESYRSRELVGVAAILMRQSHRLRLQSQVWMYSRSRQLILVAAATATRMSLVAVASCACIGLLRSCHSRPMQAQARVLRNQCNRLCCMAHSWAHAWPDCLYADILRLVGFLCMDTLQRKWQQALSHGRPLRRADMSTCNSHPLCLCAHPCGT
jgi:hypothetical protein